MKVAITAKKLARYYYILLNNKLLTNIEDWENMVYCQKCGKKNDDDAQYCNKCGNYLLKSDSFEEKVEKFAEEFVKKAEQFGKQVEKKAKEFAKFVEEEFNPKSKHCSNCNIDLNYDAKFCWKCGNRV